jgi:hypothetical protein
LPGVTTRSICGRGFFAFGRVVMIRSLSIRHAEAGENVFDLVERLVASTSIIPV